MTGQQYPTREQIAEALYASDGDPDREGDDLDWTGETDALRHVYLNNADAMLALFPQPTPSADMTAMSHETTGFCFCGQMHGLVKDWNEYDWAALRTHAPAAPEVSE